MFPIRDFVEVMFFSYLFYFQSKKESRLTEVNKKWSEINATPKLPDNSTTARDESTIRQQNGLDGENLLGEIASLNDRMSDVSDVVGARHSKSESLTKRETAPRPRASSESSCAAI